MLQFFSFGKKSIVPSIILGIIGILLLAIPYGTLKVILFSILGLSLILIYIFPCFFYWFYYSEQKKFLFEAITSTVCVVIGFLLIFWHHFVVSVIMGIFLVVLPIVRILLSENKWERFKREIPYFLIAVILFFTPFEAIFSIVLKVFGGVLILYSIGNIIYILWQNHQNKTPKNPDSSDRIIIDAEVKDID